MAQVIKNRFFRIVLWLLLSIFLLLFLIIVAVQIPYVQTKTVKYVSSRLTKAIGFEVSIEKINIDWFDQIQLEGLKVLDPEDNVMILAERLDVNYQLELLYNSDELNFDELRIRGAHVNLEKINVNDSVTLNMNELIRRVKSLRKRQTNKKNKKFFSVDELGLTSSSFSYNDPFKDSIPQGFDYYHFTVEDINGDFVNVLSVSDTFSLDVLFLKGHELRSGLNINQMTSSFSVCQKEMKFSKLDLTIGKSRIRDHIVFNYDNTRDLGSFNTKVKIKANLNEIKLHSDELEEFISTFKRLNESYELSGNFNGRVSSFLLSDAQLKFGQSSSLNGKIRMLGLPNIEETYIDFDLTNSSIKTSDIRHYLKRRTFERLEPFGQIEFNAEFLGFTTDFVANGIFHTQYGAIDSDINLKLEEDINKSVYSGKLKIKDFDLGGYTQSPFFQTVSLNGQINGMGFTIEEADLSLNGEIDKIGINGYDYTNITTDARFTKALFEGFIDIADPNLKLTTTGSIDLRDGIDLFNVKAKLDTAYFKALNITDNDLFISSNININASGLKLDSIKGTASFIDTNISYNDKSLQIDSLAMVSNKNDSERDVNINTNLFNVQINGDFDFTKVYTDLINLVKEYELGLKNDAQAIETYYSKKNSENEDYTLQYKIDLKDINPLLELFAPAFQIAGQTYFEGDLTGGYTSIISCETGLDSIWYKQNLFVRNELQLNVSKISDSTNVLAMFYGASDRQIISDVDARNLFLEGIWNNDHIDFEFDIDQVKYANHARLQGGIDFLNDSTLIKFESSEVQILDKKWAVQPNNQILLHDSIVSVENMRIAHLNQGISIDGLISPDPMDKLIFRVDSVELENLNTIINKNLSGNINGKAELSNYYQNLQVENDIALLDLMVDDFLIGDITGSNYWNSVRKQFEVELFVERLSSNILTVLGNYAPQKENELNLTANLNDTELSILEPFFSNYFTKLKGSAEGRLDIRGKLKEPIISGKGDINNGGVHVNYLNTDYRLNGGFFFKKNEIGFKNMNVFDSRNEKGNLNGSIYHKNFKQFSMDLHGKLSNFMVLNTTSKDNDLFYGTGIATGTVDFEGPVQNMNITAKATSDKGTRIFIPIGDSESIEQKDFINFTSFSDSTLTTEVVEEKVDLSGLKLDFDLNLTPDAYCEIIFDIKAGDIIRGRGNGDIKLQIDTKGEFNMFGDYVIQEGGYNFTLYNIINKEFEILPSSKISWYGDPYQGILDIDATYNQLSSFLPLLIRTESDQELNDVVELRRNYPVKVLLDIAGPLLSPRVGFDITAKNLPRNIQTPVGTKDLDFEFLAFKNSIDEQELKRQVFSLIVLRRFSPLQSFNTGGSITSSVSELLSNQLSYWITQVDENLEIDVDLGQLDDEALNTFQLRLSYTFLDGRLRVTRNGGFTNQSNRADISSIAGDWTLEYLLTSDGKFKVKMYNRTNYNPVNQQQDNQNTITTGVSIIHTQSFNELKDLMKKAQKNKKEKKNDGQRQDGIISSKKEEEGG